MAAPMHPEAEHAAGVLAGLLERHLHGRVAALHLVGSAADGDFQPGRSDLDFVAVLHEAMTDAEYEALGIVHRLYGSDPTLPSLGGIWVTEGDLAAGPDAAPDGPTSHDGLLIGVARGNRNPIIWAQLRDIAVTVFGQLNRDALWHDPARLASWTRENVEAYWAPWVERAAKLWTPPGLAMLGRSAPMWGVLGISRLHETLATGQIASKSAAGVYAKSAFDPRWHRILDECLTIRRGSGSSRYANPFARRSDALAYVRMVIAAIRAG